MESKTIEDLINSKGQNIDYRDLHSFLNQKLKELYDKEKSTPLLDYSDIRNSAMIDLIYEIMPSLKDEIDLKEDGNQIEKSVLVKNTPQ